MHIISPENLSSTRLYEENMNNTSFRITSYLNKKVNAKNTFRGGVIGSRRFFDLYARGRDEDDDQFKDFLKNDGYADVWQAYGQWKYKFHKNWTLNGGLHGMYFQLNDKQIEAFQLYFSLTSLHRSLVRTSLKICIDIKPQSLFILVGNESNCIVYCTSGS